MQRNKNYYSVGLLIIFSLVFASYASAQTDSVKSISADTISTPKSDKKATKKKVDSYILYAGVNLNSLNLSSNVYESRSAAGWHLGASYRRGNFFFWQVGARLNGAKYSLSLLNSSGADSTDDNFSVTDLDIPITAGVNLLPITKRIFNIHLFVSAAPSFQLSVADNAVGITKDKTNTFRMYGQAGVGVDVLFLVIDLGYNFGFTDLIKNVQSKPGQAFVNVGFRF